VPDFFADWWTGRVTSSSIIFTAIDHAELAQQCVNAVLWTVAPDVGTIGIHDAPIKAVRTFDPRARLIMQDFQTGQAASPNDGRGARIRRTTAFPEPQHNRTGRLGGHCFPEIPVSMARSFPRRNEDKFQNTRGTISPWTAPVERQCVATAGGKHSDQSQWNLVHRIAVVSGVFSNAA
jgi:hypothetical protein